MASRVLRLLAVLPFAAVADEPAPVTPEFLEFLAEEPAGVDGLEEALMSREIERALAEAASRRARKGPEGDDDEH